MALGWKGLPMTNTQAYYEHSLITAAKGFVTLTHHVGCLKLIKIIQI
jgi:hypothetical protein